MIPTGLASSLLDMDDATQISTHLLRGGLFENMVINEFIKRSLHQGQERRIAMSSTTETVTLPLRLERSSPGNEDITMKVAQGWKKIMIC